ncbi:hypothetical protein KEM55_007954 [Ascosphaera atra]|nr:hypothetical protein KEM55_007954 [Ascosphaera atra]
MPPIPQVHSVILPGGNVLGDINAPDTGPHHRVAHVTTRISVRAFLLLFVGTILIFGGSIVIWRIGHFLRRFSVAKVVGEKRGPPKRYAKTWHGWVEFEKHQERRRRRKQTLDGVLIWLRIKSPRERYHRLWSGSGSDASEAPDPATGAQADGANNPIAIDIERLIRPIQEDAYRPTIHHHGEPTSVRGQLDQPCQPLEAPSTSSRTPLTSVLGNCSNGLLQKQQYKMSGGDAKSNGVKMPNGRASLVKGMRVLSRSMPSLAIPATQSSLPQARAHKKCASESDQDTTGTNTAIIPRKRSISRKSCSVHRHSDESGGSRNFFRCRGNRRGSTIFALAKQYQAWNAKMQLKPLDMAGPWQGGLAGRPGTPIPHALRMMIGSAYASPASSSASSESLREKGLSMQSVYYRLPETLPRYPYRLERPSCVKMGTETASSNLGLLGDAHNDLITIPEASAEASHSAAIVRRSTSRSKDSQPAGAPLIVNLDRLNSVRKRWRTDASSRSIADNLTIPEVHLMYDLDRKLEWLSGELEPYRRPSSFLLVFNHWLNKDTWVVYDGPGRVPLHDRLESDRKRRKKAAQKKGEEKGKGPDVQQEEHTSQGETMEPSKSSKKRRLNSWRHAINSARRSSGLETFLQGANTLSSIDDPPDGVIDTASWVIRRPPQGFPVSKRQATAYFEGTGGVFETYQDWQNVGRCYGLKRLIPKDLVATATSTCQRAKGVLASAMTESRCQRRSKQPATCENRQRNERQRRSGFRRRSSGGQCGEKRKRLGCHIHITAPSTRRRRFSMRRAVLRVSSIEQTAVDPAGVATDTLQGFSGNQDEHRVN